MRMGIKDVTTRNNNVFSHFNDDYNIYFIVFIYIYFIVFIYNIHYIIFNYLF